VSEVETSLDRRLRAIREAFDDTFARPIPMSGAAVRARALRVEAGNSAYVVTLDACAAVVPSPHVHPLPAAHPAFAGVAMVQGVMLPVYTLATLLAMVPGERSPAWLLVTRGPEPIGLLVDAVQGPEVVELPDGGGDDEPASVLFSGTPTRRLQLDAIVDNLRRELDRRRSDGSEMR
jgi:hypothetical protein